jgi:hypothetical protein
MLEKEIEFNDKKYLSDTSNLKLENERLRQQVSSEKDRSQNESDLNDERLKETHEESLRNQELKYHSQLADIKDIQ